MKNSVCLWLLLLAALFVTSCQEEENVPDVAGVIQYSWTSDEKLEAGDTSAEYTFEAAAPWTASSKEAWCRILTPSGPAGEAVLQLELDPNVSDQQRFTIITLSFGEGYKDDTFVLTQKAAQGGGSTAAGAANEVMSEFLSTYYLWNEAFRASVTSADLSIPYASDADNYLTRTLTRLGQAGEIPLDFKVVEGSTQAYLYSNVTRTLSQGRSASTRAAGEIDHGDVVQKTQAPGYGFAMLQPISFVDENYVPLGIYGFQIQALYPGSPAEEAGLERGDLIAQLDGGDITQWETAYMELMAPQNGSSVTLRLNEVNGQPYRVTAALVDYNPVLAHDVFEAGGRRIGYLHYLSFDAAYDNELLAAVKDLKAQGVDDLILDLRYNGGGHVMTANMLSTLIAGSQSDGQVFSYYRYNDERMGRVELTSQETGLQYDSQAKLFAEPFYYGDYDGADLSSYGLGLSRLYVLTSAYTASASEAVVNSLRGIGVDVLTVGSRSEGKNVGMEVVAFTDDQGYDYELAPITFQIYNARQYSIEPTGILPDIAADDYTSAPFGEDDDLIAAAIADITGVGTPAVATKVVPLVSGRRVQLLDRPLPQLPVRRPQGALVLPRADAAPALR